MIIKGSFFLFVAIMFLVMGFMRYRVTDSAATNNPSSRPPRELPSNKAVEMRHENPPAAPLEATGSAKHPNIDILAGTLNGTSLSDLTVDHVTDVFGRPSATTSARFEEGMELPSTIAYSELGMTFRFRSPTYGAPQQLVSIQIYLSQQQDESTRTIMKPFSGTLSRGINANWKAMRVMEEFAQSGPIDDYDPKEAEKLRMQHEAYRLAAVAIGSDIISTGDSTEALISMQAGIRINTDQTFICIKYEEQTKFLERMEIGPRRKQSK